MSSIRRKIRKIKKLFDQAWREGKKPSEFNEFRFCKVRRVSGFTKNNDKKD